VASTLSPQRNTLTYHEDRNSRSFEASLTDPAMQGLGDVLGEFFAQRGAARTAQQHGRFNKGVEVLAPHALPNGSPPPSPTPEEIVDGARPPGPSPAADGNALEKARLQKIFTLKSGSFELSDNRLKAKNARDYVRRLTYLFLYAHEIHALPYSTEAAVKAILQSAKSWDASGNTNAWLKKRIGIAQEGEDRLKLTAPGREGAVATLKDALDANVSDTWNPDKNAPKQRAPRKKKA
jgi:hypothetical protein